MFALNISFFNKNLNLKAPVIITEQRCLLKRIQLYTENNMEVNIDEVVYIFDTDKN